MKKISCFVFLFFIKLIVYGQMDDKQRDAEFLQVSGRWFAAWELVSKDFFGLNSLQPVDFVFFDDKYVYYTADGDAKNNTAITGPKFFQLALNWKKKMHNDTLLLPDKSIVPVGIMSFAAPSAGNDSRAFFVMPLQVFWQKAGVTSEELGLEKLITGVFLHEFSHSQQIQNFGKKITVYEKNNDFGIPFTDDIIQNLFNKDTSYVRLYNKELAHFYNSIKNKTLNETELKSGLKKLEQRHRVFFKGKYKQLAEIDNLFLTMEGLGQYAMYLWLTSPQGGAIEKETAIKGVRRNGKWWSQDEGLALFLALDQICKSKVWAKSMFGEETQSVIELINNGIK